MTSAIAAIVLVATENRVARYVERASPNMVTAVLTGLASVIGGVINAWLFLIKGPA